MEYKLLCIDLDGTLLADDKKVGKQDIEAIQRAVAGGATIALITNRMPAATVPVVTMLGVPCIMACNAGTCIMEGEQCIFAKYLPLGAMREIYESIKFLGTPLWIYRDEQWLVTAKNRFVETEEEIIQYQAEPVSAGDLLAGWEREEKEPNEILIIDEPALVQKAYAILKDRPDVDVTYSSPDCMEILPKGTNKGMALRAICDRKGIRREETIAFGDHRMDIPLLDAAGVAVAMGNALDELKARADFVTRTNNEAGVAYALEHYFNRKEG